MTLQRKSILTVLGSAAAILLILYFLSSYILLNGFNRVEEDLHKRDVTRVVNTLDVALENLTITCRDWSEWDDTYAFMNDEAPRYESVNLPMTTAASLEVNYMLFVDKSMRLKTFLGYDLEEEEELELPPELLPALLKSPGFSAMSPGGGIGILLLPDSAPLRVSAWPILTSEREGPPNGMFVLGRYLDEREIAALAQQTESRISLFPLQHQPLDDMTAELVREVRKSGETHVLLADKETIEGYAIMPDLYGQPGLLLNVAAPRSVYAQGHLTMQYYLIALALCCVAFLILLLVVLRTFVLEPLRRLSNNVQVIGEQPSLSARLPDDRGDDELAEFSRSLNQALARLESNHVALTTARQRYQDLVEALPEPLLLLTNGGISYANPATAVAFDTDSVEALLGRSIRDFIHPESWKQWDVTAAAGKTPKASTVRLRLNTEEQTVCYVEAVASEVEVENGTAMQLLLVNVTEKLRIDESQLRRDRLESIGTLAGGLAHDFNNLLTTILGAFSLIELGREVPPEILRLVRRGEEACTRARRLTGQLLTFARGHSPMRRLVDVSTLLDEHLDGLVLAGSTITCRLEFEESLPAVDADPEQLDQMFANLLLNARQAMPDGGIIRVTGRKVEVVDEQGHPPLTKGAWLHIAIIDQGIGIPPELRDKIFDPYFTTSDERSGLGLSVAYAILRKHRGHIELESKVGEGTTLHLYLPASAEPVPAKSPAAPRVASTRMADSGKRRILILDDDDLVRRIVQEMVESAGYTVVATAAGEQTIEEYKRAQNAGTPFDMVILDLTIVGGMGGRETMAALRAMDPRVCAILSSGYTSDDTIVNYSAYGFREVIKKPYRSQELVALIGMTLEGELCAYSP